MRAMELPSPATLKRRLSPLPMTLAALVLLLMVRLWGFVPEPLPFLGPGGGDGLAELAPAGGPLTVASAVAASPATDSSAPPARGEQGTAGLIEPAAGAPGLDDDPLRPEPFLEERRELARQQEALQIRQLAIQAAEERLRGLLAELQTVRAEVGERLAELEAKDEERMADLVTLYETMKPKKAAIIFDDLDFQVLAPLALRIDQRKLASIVAAMNPLVARRLTTELARQRYDPELETAATAR